MSDSHYDWIIIGSGFGGSVSALRLAEKGYRVLVIEKGRRFAPGDFPVTNWDLRRWMWMPAAGLRGFFQMSFFEHVTILHGVGVGGGSLTYANTLPMPKLGFFQSKSWAHLADWRRELEPHYATARKMLGSAETRVYAERRDPARDRQGHGAAKSTFTPPTWASTSASQGRRSRIPTSEAAGPTEPAAPSAAGA